MLPPPPPPPPGPLPIGQVNKPSTLSKNSVPDRNALLSQIRSGTTLKKAVTNDKSVPVIGSKASLASSTGTLRSKTGSELPAPSSGPVSLGNLFANGMPKLRSTGNRFGDETKNVLLHTDKPAPLENKLKPFLPSSNSSTISGTRNSSGNVQPKNFELVKDKFNLKCDNTTPLHNSSSAIFGQNKFNTVRNFSSNSHSKPPLPEGPKPALLKVGNGNRQDNGSTLMTVKTCHKLSGSHPDLSNTNTQDGVKLSNNVKSLQKSLELNNSPVLKPKPLNHGSHPSFGSLSNVKDEEKKAQNLSYQSSSAETLLQSSTPSKLSKVNFRDWALSPSSSVSSHPNFSHSPLMPPTKAPIGEGLQTKKLPQTLLTNPSLSLKPTQTSSSSYLKKTWPEKIQEPPPPPPPTLLQPTQTSSSSYLKKTWPEKVQEPPPPPSSLPQPTQTSSSSYLKKTWPEKVQEPPPPPPPPPSSPPPDPPSEVKNSVILFSQNAALQPPLIPQHPTKSPSLPPRASSSLRHPPPSFSNKSPTLPQRRTVPPVSDHNVNESFNSAAYNRPLPAVPASQRSGDHQNFNQSRPLPAVPLQAVEKAVKPMQHIADNIKPTSQFKSTGNFESRFVGKFHDAYELPKPEPLSNGPKTYLSKVPQRMHQQNASPHPPSRPPPLPPLPN